MGLSSLSGVVLTRLDKGHDVASVAGQCFESCSEGGSAAESVQCNVLLDVVLSLSPVAIEGFHNFGASWRCSLCSLGNLDFVQIVDQKVPPKTDPAPSEPYHLTPVSSDHSLLCFCPGIDAAYEEHQMRIRRAGLFTSTTFELPQTSTLTAERQRS